MGRAADYRIALSELWVRGISRIRMTLCAQAQHFCVTVIPERCSLIWVVWKGPRCLSGSVERLSQRRIC